MRSSIAAITLVASFLLLAGASSAEQWVSLGPIVERSVQQVEVDAGGGQELYALSDVGVLWSQDGGATWELGGEGLREVTMDDYRLSQLVADPHRPGALYATVSGIGVFRSFDDGAHWHPAANRGLPAVLGPIDDLEVAPNRPSMLYMATSKWVFVSEDGGDSWTAPGPAPPMTNSPADLAIDPTNPDTLYVVGFHDAIHGRPSFAYKSQDGGASWQELDIEPALDFDVPPAAVVVTSGEPGTVYVAASTGKIIRSTDGGTTWTRAHNGLPVGNVDHTVVLRALAAHPSEPATLYVSLDSDNGLPPRGVYRTLDGGDHWEPVGAWPADQPVPRDFAFPLEDPSSVLAAPGPFLSPSLPGTAWRSRRPLLPAYSRFVTPHPSDPDVLFTESYPSDFRRSADGGATWQPFARSLPSSSGYLDLVVDPNAPQTLYALDGYPYKSTDGGLTWTEKADGLDPLHGLRGLVIDPVDSERLYGWDFSTLFGTRDGGETWSALFEGGDDSVRSFAVDPTDTDVLYLGAAKLEGPDGGVRVCRSDDAGSTWSCVDTGLPGGYVPVLRVDPDRPNHIYGVWNPGAFLPSKVVRSLDGGATWSVVTSGDLPAVPIVDLAIRSGAGPTTLWAATDGRGVYRSTDGGDSWVPVRTGLETLRVNELSSGPGGLYAATDLGNYRLDESPGAGEPLPPDDVPWVEDPAVPGFRIKTRIDQGGGITIPGTQEPACIPETVCFSGALPGRDELFVRIVGPKGNGWLWPTLVKFSTSRIEVWIEQESTDRLRYYELSGAQPDSDELPGLFDRFGFTVVPGAP